jgi:hypothetical protein
VGCFEWNHGCYDVLTYCDEVVERWDREMNRMWCII